MTQNKTGKCYFKKIKASRGKFLCNTNFLTLSLFFMHDFR